MKSNDLKASKNAISVSCCLVLSFLMSPSPSAQAQWKGKVASEDGVTVVHNPKGPIFQTPILELTEELSIGGPEAQGQAVFKRMREFVNDDADNFYISDVRGEDCIKVFDKAGRYLKTIGRHGQGPGEFDGIEVNRLTCQPTSKSTEGGGHKPKLILPSCRAGNQPYLANE